MWPFIQPIYAACTDGIFGCVTNDLVTKPNGTLAEGGLLIFFTNILRLVFVVAGVFAFMNLIIAGFSYMTAGGDAKALAAAWNRIWQSLFGLVVIVGSFALAAIFGQLIFNNPMFILSPTIYGPPTP